MKNENQKKTEEPQQHWTDEMHKNMFAFPAPIIIHEPLPLQTNFGRISNSKQHKKRGLFS